jgi:dTDP-4-amino-4,6-dideoxygalactose transaminase
MLDAAQLAAAITPRTRAIVPVHLYGAAADMDAIGAVAARHGVPVVEDCAQSHGSEWNGRRTGTQRRRCVQLLSEQEPGALGDGGACLTQDAALDARRRLRNYGQADRYTQVERGLNSRLDELQAALLRAKLPHLTAWNARRGVVAARHAAGPSSCPDASLITRAGGAFGASPPAIRHLRRDALVAFLRSAAWPPRPLPGAGASDPVYADRLCAAPSRSPSAAGERCRCRCTRSLDDEADIVRSGRRSISTTT